MSTEAWEADARDMKLAMEEVLRQNFSIDEAKDVLIHWRNNQRASRLQRLIAAMDQQS